MWRCCLTRLPNLHLPDTCTNHSETSIVTHNTLSISQQCATPLPPVLRTTAHTIVGVPAIRFFLYLRAHARDMLGDLSGPQFSAVISLFGTLSVPDPPRKFRTWWGFIFQMVRDKKRATGILTEGDLYWLMRARASEAALVDSDVYAGGDVSDPRLMAARERYLTLDVNTSSPDDHEPYLKTLLSLNKQDTMMEVIAWLCFLMKRDIYCSPNLLEVLWDVVLTADKVLSDDLKETILGIMSQRLSLPVGFTEESRARFTSLPPEPEADAPEFHPSFCLTASDLTHQIVRILFPRITPSLSGTPSQLAIQEWAHSETQRMFNPSARIEFRWQNLVYLALATTRTPIHSLAMVPTLHTNDSARSSAVGVRLVAVIALVERIANVCGVSSDLRSLVHALWASWVEVANNDAHAHRALVRPLLGTFFRLAALARDTSLVYSCVRLASVGFWQFDLGDDTARRQAQLLAVEYLTAARIVTNLPPHIVFPQWHPMLLSKTILRLVRLDAQRAVEVYHLWQPYLPVPDLSTPLGVMLIQEGRTDLAIPMLANVVFTGPVVGTILHPLAKRGNQYIDLNLAAILAKALLTVFASEAPPRTAPARRHMAWALLALACSGQAPAAISTFKNVHRHNRGFFNDRTVCTFLRTLLYHRQFRGAAEIAKLYPHTRWRRFVLLGLARKGGASQVEAQLGGSVRPKWFTDVVARIRSGRRHPAAGLLRQWVTRRARTRADVRDGLKVLVRARGVNSAKRVYRILLCASLDARSRTALGNVILDGHVARTTPKSRGARHVKSVQRTLRMLVHDHGFVPDRVTTNIIVRAALRWPTVLDASLVRRLFDYFVWSGYPGGVGVGVPFGSGEAVMREAALVLGNSTPIIPMSKSSRKKISFVRHVRPLYKMFIKALFLRKDVAGGRKVVGILKEVERMEAERIASERRRERENG
ncbi:hypothetical protein BGW80DRAFT_1316170 [Lactifluus volemus]|nr:hypothetical protein BGW80DRAFT_1316170 [Lactifluus volemus]